MVFVREQGPADGSTMSKTVLYWKTLVAGLLLQIASVGGAADGMIPFGPRLPAPSASQLDQAMAYGDKFQAQMPARLPPNMGYPYIFRIPRGYIRPSRAHCSSGIRHYRNPHCYHPRAPSVPYRPYRFTGPVPEKPWQPGVIHHQ